MKISENQLRICGLGLGKECCSYLGRGSEGFICLKHGELRGEIDARRTEGKMIAMGDNCEGLKEVMS
jgi:hypothetical protein